MTVEQYCKYANWIAAEYAKTTTMWWGYLHSNGSIQVKRWFGDHKDYIDDCIDNPFVTQVVPPFSAESREEAINCIKVQVENNGLS